MIVFFEAKNLRGEKSFDRLKTGGVRMGVEEVKLVKDVAAALSAATTADALTALPL
ncbi:MAG: hypothetical protein PF904_19760 [Kiritimatiellae bacterium]|nr:hypothetical protein [Kiritimatiellia bacterium]